MKKHGGKRTGSGRKSLASGKSKQLSVTLPPDLIKWCKAQNISASAYIRKLIEQDIGNLTPN